MEILSSGSFINLENQEKIEQLKFTAVQLANAAIETEGFVNTEDSGKNIALEFWQGLEYMCRDTEEATIKNIFLNHFLDYLRNARSTQPTGKIDLPGSAQIVSEPLNHQEKTEDEFLGVIEMTVDEETSTDEITDEFEENLPQTELISASEISSIQETVIKTTENESSESFEETVSTPIEIEEKIEPKEEISIETKTLSGNLSLPEKEPYQFNKCTVTAMIQLLPTVDGAIRRKAVFSVRTHDFTPQYMIVELAGNNLTAEIMPELENVLAKYQSDLPAKVMDKLKKEKLTAKKSAPKLASEAKTVSQEVEQPKESGTTQTDQSKANQTDTPITPPPMQTGQQGSLFGF